VTKFDETKANLVKQCDLIISKKKDGEEGEPEEAKVVEVGHLKGADGIPDFWSKAFKNC